jgi:hypothetical protein
MTAGGIHDSRWETWQEVVNMTVGGKYNYVVNMTLSGK